MPDEEIGNKLIHEPLKYEADNYITYLDNFIKKLLEQVYLKFFQAFLRVFNNP